MARRLVRVLNRIAREGARPASRIASARWLLACPICAAPEGARLGEGARAGALALIVVTAIVVAPMIWYGVRLWRAERENR